MHNSILKIIFGSISLASPYKFMSVYYKIHFEDLSNVLTEFLLIFSSQIMLPFFIKIFWQSNFIDDSILCLRLIQRF